MGNTGSTPETKTNIVSNSAPNKNPMNSNEDEIVFDQILEVSKELLQRYNQDFLREEFCYDLAFVLEEHLSKMSVNVLNEMAEKVEGSEVTPKIKMIMQYTPKQDEQFFIEGFEKQLDDYFWNQNVDFQKSIIDNAGISTENVDISDLRIFRDKNKLKYIDIQKINELLRDSVNPNGFRKNKNPRQENENEVVENQETPVAEGGGNIENFKRRLNSELAGNTKNRGSSQQQQQQQKRNMRVQIVKNEENENSIGSNNLNIQKLRSALFQGENKKPNSNGNRNQRPNANLNENITQLVRQLNVEINQKNQKMKEEGEKEKVNKNSTREEIRTEVNRMVQNQQKPVSTSTNANVKPPNGNAKPSKVNEEAPKPPKVNEEGSNMNAKPPKMNERPPNANVKPLKVNERPPNANVKTPKVNERPLNKQQGSKFVQYDIRREYHAPSKMCLDGVEKCMLSKKDLCKVITENLIVRCNIVAAILTVLPNRKIRGGYVGGYLYQKFMNLGKCQVCVPYNYKDLIELSPIQLIKHVVQYADFLDPKSCKENGGYYMKLSKGEMEALYKNVPDKDQIDIGKQMNYNAFYIQCAKKLKESYFDNLKVLLTILEELRTQPLMNNVSLNELGKKTKEIIDTMYHLCQYYYIYAIVSLLNANLNQSKVGDVDLQKSFTKILKLSEKS